MKHTHHIIPRHAGGTDDISNLIELTIEEHAEAHHVLWEQYGRLQDKIAWLMLSGKTEEAEKFRVILATQRFHEFVSDLQRREAWRQKIAEKLRGGQQTPESNEKRSVSLKKFHTDNPQHREKLSRYVQEHIQEYRQRMNGGLSEKMAEARKNSSVWHTAVRSSEYRNKKSLADPRRRNVIVEGQIYHSLREAVRKTGYTYNKLRWHLIHHTNPDFIRYA